MSRGVEGSSSRSSKVMDREMFVNERPVTLDFATNFNEGMSIAMLSYIDVECYRERVPRESPAGQ